MNSLDLVQAAAVGTYTAGLAAAAAVGKLLYWATVPFRYPAYYLWAVLSFALSPLWFLVDLARSTALLALQLAERSRYVYIYFACATMIGLLAAFALHGTSSLLFVMLRLHPCQQPASSPAPASRARHPHPLDAAPGAPEPARRIAAADEDDDEDEDDFDFGATTSSSRTSASTTTTSDAPVVGLRNRRGERDTSSALGDLYGNHWRALSDHRKAPVKSRHRGKLKGLLAQTIHEESSESESL